MWVFGQKCKPIVSHNPYGLSSCSPITMTPYCGKGHAACPMISQAHFHLPSGKHTKNYGKSPFWMGKSTISMAMFNSYVSLPEALIKPGRVLFAGDMATWYQTISGQIWAIPILLDPHWWVNRRLEISDVLVESLPYAQCMVYLPTFGWFLG